MISVVNDDDLLARLLSFKQVDSDSDEDDNQQFAFPSDGHDPNNDIEIEYIPTIEAHNDDEDDSQPEKNNTFLSLNERKASTLINTAFLRNSTWKPDESNRISKKVIDILADIQEDVDLDISLHESRLNDDSFINAVNFDFINANDNS